MRAWKQRGLAILLAGVLCLGGSTGLTTLAYADEAEETSTEAETPTLQDDVDSGSEDMTAQDEEAPAYPEAWDADDPMNEKAFEQLQAAEEAESFAEGGYVAPRLEAGVITTKYGNNTYTHRETNTNGTTLKLGIDISYYNNYSSTAMAMQEINWSKVKASGVEFVILRLGYRTSSSGSLNEDKWFAKNYQGAKAAGLKVGGYFFSQAINTSEAVEEANYAIAIAEKYNCKFDLPLAFDIEESSTSSGRFTAANLTKAQKTADCQAFCSTVEAAGYDAMVYSGSWYFACCLDAKALRAEYPLWSARYNYTDYDAVSDAGKAFYTGRVDYWQCSGTASVSGVPSTCTDLDYYYCPDNSVHVRLDSDGVRRYYDADGNFDDTYTGVCKGTDGWWYVQNGVVDTTYTGLASNVYGWWRIESGKVNFSYNGFAEYNDCWWYLSGGKVQFAATGVVKGTVDGTTAWWYIHDGQVDLTAETVAKNSYGWWYVKDGKVDFTYTGLAKNGSGWWYIRSGKLDFSYTGFAENEYGWWYVKNGKLGFDTTSVVKGTVDGAAGWWYVYKNKADLTANTVAKNAYGWFYIKNGKVDFTYTGVAKNSSGWWRIESGKVNFKFYGIAKNSYGWWYLKKGKVDFSYTGTVKVNASTNRVSSGTKNTVSYSVTKGKVKK